jgi:Cd2+/Zn2+-exporting ATPase
MNTVFKNKNLKLLTLVAGVVLILEILGIFNIHLPIVIEIPIFVLVILTIGRKVLTGGLEALVHLKFSNMYLLMTIAIIGAVLIGEFEEAAVIVSLFAVSEKLEDLGIETSQSAIESLVNKTPKQVNLKSGITKNIDDVLIGDIFIVKPGEIIGLDGVVIEGVSNIDESAITGEPIPSEKVKGSNVFAGTINKQGYLEIEVSKLAENSVVQRIVDLTSKATANKANYQQFIEKFSTIYTPIVFVIALLVVLIPTLLGQNFLEWFERGITLLLIACPCALVISTPISIFSAVGNASTKGILIKGGRFLEELGDIKAIAFDKTRTLTLGKPVVKDVITFQNATQEEILACAAGIENKSEHPLSIAVINYAKDHNLKFHEIKDFRAITGKGITADCLVCKVGTCLLGNLDLILEKHNSISKDIIYRLNEIQERGDTPVILADKEGVKGIIVIADKIRDESVSLIRELKRLNIVPILLTGDNQRTANSVAHYLHIDKVYGDLLPEGKVERLKEIQNDLGAIAMVGDGVNDAPVLATSNIGIAMGAVGSDVAIESANIALMNDKIELIPFLINLGKHTKRTIQANIVLALITKLVALALATTGFIGLGIAIFADVGVTIIVILLSLNIMNFKFEYNQNA